MSALPTLTRVLINTARGNSKIWGVVTMPRPGTHGSVSLGPVTKMLQTRRGSVASPGDSVIDLGDRFVLGYFSSGVNDEIFRMFRTPMSGEVARVVNGKDPVTGFDRGGKPTTLGVVWFDIVQTGLAPDVDSLKRVQHRIITGFPLEVGDRLKDMKITSVTTELGITIAEAE
jgi:hypothetical protein